MTGLDWNDIDIEKGNDIKEGEKIQLLHSNRGSSHISPGM